MWANLKAITLQSAPCSAQLLARQSYGLEPVFLQDVQRAIDPNMCCKLIDKASKSIEGDPLCWSVVDQHILACFEECHAPRKGSRGSLRESCVSKGTAIEFQG